MVRRRNCDNWRIPGSGLDCSIFLVFTPKLCKVLCLSDLVFRPPADCGNGMIEKSSRNLRAAFVVGRNWSPGYLQVMSTNGKLPEDCWVISIEAEDALCQVRTTAVPSAQEMEKANRERFAVRLRYQL